MLDSVALRDKLLFITEILGGSISILFLVISSMYLAWWVTLLGFMFLIFLTILTIVMLKQSKDIEACISPEILGNRKELVKLRKQELEHDANVAKLEKFKNRDY